MMLPVPGQRSQATLRGCWSVVSDVRSEAEVVATE